MNDYIRIPRSIQTEALWHNGNLARLYFFLLSKTDDNGIIEISLREIARYTKLTLKEVRVGLAKLQTAQLAAQKRAHLATQITVCGIKGSHSHATQGGAQRGAQSTAQPQDGFERFRNYFNTVVADTSIPQITKLTDARKNALRSIFKEHGRETIENVIQKVIESDFLTKEWGKVNFDWIFKKSNFIKILEGNYDNRTNIKQATDKYAARRGTDVGNHTAADYGGPF